MFKALKNNTLLFIKKIFNIKVLIMVWRVTPLILLLLIGGVVLSASTILTVGAESEIHKIWICHVPLGDTENKQAIYVDANSWDGHIHHNLDFIISGEFDESCQSANPTNIPPTNTLEPTNTPEPTSTLVPTSTLEPTSTLQPTSTPTKKPTRIPQTRTPIHYPTLTPTPTPQICMSDCEFKFRVVDLLEKILEVLIRIANK